MNTFIAFVIWLEIVSAALLFGNQPFMPHLQIHHDPRIAQIGQFESKHHFNGNYAKIFISCADQYQVDWRLLPAIALEESSGFKRYPIQTANGLGWNSANYRFQSIEDSICFVDRQIATASPYRGRSLAGILHSYNPNPRYAPIIIRYMNEINSTAQTFK